jgi:hypothetical protein
LVEPCALLVILGHGPQDNPLRVRWLMLANAGERSLTDRTAFCLFAPKHILTCYFFRSG